MLGRRLELIAVDPHGDGPTAVAPDARYGTEDEDVTVDLRRERNVLLAVGFDMGYGMLFEVNGDDFDVDSCPDPRRSALNVNPEIPRAPVADCRYVECVGFFVTVERLDNVKAVEVAADQLLVLIFGDREKPSVAIPIGV